MSSLGPEYDAMYEEPGCDCGGDILCECTECPECFEFGCDCQAGDPLDDDDDYDDEHIDPNDPFGDEDD